MAGRRMFSREVTDSDRFVSIPLSSQGYYLHLGQASDDEGFVDAPKRIMRAVNASEGDLEHLVAKGFVHIFDSGVALLNHFHVNNKLRKDRMKPTIYIEERAMVQLDENGVYRVGEIRNVTNVNQVSTKCPRRRVEVRLDEVRVGEEASPASRVTEGEVSVSAQGIVSRIDISLDRDGKLSDKQKDVLRNTRAIYLRGSKPSESQGAWVIDILRESEDRFRDSDVFTNAKRPPRIYGDLPDAADVATT